MRRLLFSASLLIFVGCSSQKGEVAKPIDESVGTKTEIESIATDSDGAKATSNGPKKMKAGKAEISTDSDPSANEDRREMPRHNAPDQDQIDSIKQEKQKKKK